MTSTLFQQFQNLLKEIHHDDSLSDITTYDTLVNELFE